MKPSRAGCVRAQYLVGILVSNAVGNVKVAISDKKSEVEDRVKTAIDKITSKLKPVKVLLVEKVQSSMEYFPGTFDEAKRLIDERIGQDNVFNRSKF